MCVCACVRVCVHAGQHLQRERAEDNLEQSVVFFHLGCKCLSLAEPRTKSFCVKTTFVWSHTQACSDQSPKHKAVLKIARRLGMK